METTVLVGLVAVLATLVAQYFFGPLIWPWYNERLQKAQLRVQRRAEQRRMIENELEKGFEDLSGVRAFAIAKRLGQDQQFNAVQLYKMHEEKWGVWRPYLIEGEELLMLCEKYRALIRDLRTSALALTTDEIDKREKRVGNQMSSKAREIVGLLNQRNW